MGPPRGCLARYHCVVRGRWGISRACHDGGGMPHCNASTPFGNPSSRKCSTGRPSTSFAPGSSWISLEACLLNKFEGDGGGTQRRWKTRHNEGLYNHTLYAAQQCLLPSGYGECFPRCLLPSLYGECIDCGLDLGTQRFRFGQISVWTLCGQANFLQGGPPLGALTKKSRQNVMHVGATPKRGNP